MANNLATQISRSSGSGSTPRANGWTPERRARQAAAIRRWQPWRRATGPKTEAGKAPVASNALRHGHRGRAWIERARRIRNAIRLCAQTLLLARVLREQERRAQLDSIQQTEVLRRMASRRLAQDRG